MIERRVIDVVVDFNIFIGEIKYKVINSVAVHPNRMRSFLCASEGRQVLIEDKL